MNVRTRLRRALAVFSALVGLVAAMGAGGAGCTANYKPPYVPILVSVNGGGQLDVSYDASYVTPIGTFDLTGTTPVVDLQPGDVLLEIRHWRADVSENVKSLFRVRGLDEGVTLTTTGSSGVQVSGDRATAVIDLPRETRELAIAPDGPGVTAAPSSGSTSKWTEPKPTHPAPPTATVAPRPQPFKMSIDGVRAVPGRGTLVTGEVRRGVIRVGDSVVVAAPGAEAIPGVVVGLEKPGRSVSRAITGDVVGVLLRGVSVTSVTGGRVLEGRAAAVFRMSIAEVRVIPGRGTMVTGKIQQGVLRIGDPVSVAKPDAKAKAGVVVGLEHSGKSVERANTGDTVGVLLRGVSVTSVTDGRVLLSS